MWAQGWKELNGKCPTPNKRLHSLVTSTRDSGPLPLFRKVISFCLLPEPSQGISTALRCCCHHCSTRQTPIAFILPGSCCHWDCARERRWGQPFPERDTARNQWRITRKQKNLNTPRNTENTDFSSKPKKFSLLRSIVNWLRPMVAAHAQELQASAGVFSLPSLSWLCRRAVTDTHALWRSRFAVR